MTKKKRSKVATGPLPTHNGVYRVEEIADAFGIPRSVVYLWTAQEKIVKPDYIGRSRRPSLFIGKSVAAILLIRELLAGGMSKPDVKRFFKIHQQAIYADKVTLGRELYFGNGLVTHSVKIGAIRSISNHLMEKYLENAKKPRVESSPVPAHSGEPVEAASGVAPL